MEKIYEKFLKTELHIKGYILTGLFTMVLFAVGLLSGSIPLLFLACLVFQINSIVASLNAGYRGVLYIVYQLLFFLFLMGRYFVTIFMGFTRNYGGVYDSGFTREVVIRIFILYGIALLFMELTYRAYEKVTGDEKRLIPSASALTRLKESRAGKGIGRLISPALDRKTRTAIFLICLLGMVISAFTKIHYYMAFAEYVKEVGYSQSYLTGLPGYPGILYLISRTFEIFFFTAIALRPRIKYFTLISLFYLLVASGELNTGRRMQLMQSFLIIAVFFFIHYWNGLSKRLRKVLLVGALIAIPVMIIGLQMISNLRYNQESSRSIIAIATEFFYNQGISTRVLGEAIEHQNEFPDNKLYSLGPVVDLFNALAGNPVPARSSVESALHGHVFSDAVSYIVSRINYAAGISLGSSYIAELYIDFRLFGVMAGSALYGFIFRFTEYRLKSRNVLVIVPLLLVARELIIAPRSQYLKFLFGVSPTNLMLFLGIYILCRILSVQMVKKTSSTGFEPQ